MIEILNRNFQGSEILFIGLVEYRLPNGQYGTDVINDLENCTVFFYVINLKK